MSEMKCELKKLLEIISLCQSLDKMQCFLSQNANVLCEGIECENAVNLSMNCNSIDLNSCKISDKMLSNHNTINTLNTYHYFRCFWPKCQYKTRLNNDLYRHKLNHLKEQQFKCNYNNCKKVYTSRRNLFSHKNSDHLNVRYICDWSEC